MIEMDIFIEITAKVVDIISGMFIIYCVYFTLSNYRYIKDNKL